MARFRIFDARQQGHPGFRAVGAGSAAEALSIVESMPAGARSYADVQQQVDGRGWSPIQYLTLARLAQIERGER